MDNGYLQTLAKSEVEWSEKGLPYGGSVSPVDVARKKWNVKNDDLHLPLMVLRESALAANLKAMSEWCAAQDYLLSPHGKTTMCPRIFERQLAGGAWAMTVANASQLLVCVRLGITRILVANQLTGRANIESVARAMMDAPELTVYCLVDSVDGVEHLSSLLRNVGFTRRLKVLLEWGKSGWRTGVRSEEQARRVAAAVNAASDVLELAGVEAFEGIAHNDDESALLRELDGFLAGVERVSREMAHPGDWIFSVGGSAFLDRVHAVFQRVPVQWKRVLRSGCYVTHDHGYYDRAFQAARRRAGDRIPEFRQALEIWSYVQSVPDPGQALLSFGKRDAPYDSDLPLPLDLPGAVIHSTNDQHAYMSLPEGVAVRVGDKVRCGISHPCTAFDKWRVIPVVDDEYNVIDLYRTCF